MFGNFFFVPEEFRKIVVSVAFSLIFFIVSSCFCASAQDALGRFRIEEAVVLALNNSNDAKTYKNYFLSSYWYNRSFNAKYLPAINFSSNLPSYNKQMQQGVDKGEVYYYPQNLLTESFSLSINQNIPLTGGTISFYTYLNRVDQFDPNRSFTYNSAPFGIVYSQSLFGVNPFKWDKKISPLYFEEAKRSYLHNREAVRTTAISYFFNLLTAQQNLKISKENFSNIDTLYKITQQKFKIGSIAKDELMQMKLSVLNAETAYDQNLINLEANKNSFRSYLGITDKKDIELIVPLNVPFVVLEYNKVLDIVKKNHVTPVSNQRQFLESEYRIAVAKGAARPNASLYVSMGTNQNGTNLEDAYKEIRDYQIVTVSLAVPILDWGMREGNVQMAKANMEALKGRISQSESDLEQYVYLSVMRYNMMAKKIRVVASSDTIARSRYDAAKERFLSGRITVTDLNIAQSEKNTAQSTYIYAIREYWMYYYEIQRIALYDFINNAPIEADFDGLVKE